MFVTKVVAGASLEFRKMSDSDWVDTHGSGTLRKNARLGFCHRDQYIHERLAWEFGDVFEVLPPSRVMMGNPITEGDCKAVTESGWYIDRYITKMKSIFPDDIFIPVYLNISYTDGTVREGIGIFCQQTTASWLPQIRSLVGIVAEYDPIKKAYLPAVNPA